MKVFKVSDQNNKVRYFELSEEAGAPVSSLLPQLERKCRQRGLQKPEEIQVNPLSSFDAVFPRTFSADEFKELLEGVAGLIVEDHPAIYWTIEEDGLHAEIVDDHGKVPTLELHRVVHLVFTWEENKTIQLTHCGEFILKLDNICYHLLPLKTFKIDLGDAVK